MLAPWKQSGAALAAAVLMAAALAVGFLVATTFIGDDHIFLAFARYAGNPLVAFGRDQHGGEYYRPFPMLVWWLLTRSTEAAGHLPFALLSCGLHVVASLQVGALVHAVLLRQDSSNAPAQTGGRIAAAMFFLSPLTQEAAFWYSASTDLFATVFVLAALGAHLRGLRWRAVIWYAAACLCKESVLAMPLFALLLALVSGRPRPSWILAVRQSAGLIAVAVVYLVVRTVVLQGAGHSGDPSASLTGKLVQISAGMVHLASGQVLSDQSLTWLLGLLALVSLLAGALRGWRINPTAAIPEIGLPLLWLLLATGPLLAAAWVVGARYFYLPAVGAAWLGGVLLRRAPTPVVVALLAVLSGLDFAQVLARRADVRMYDARIAAATRAVVDGVTRGHRVFHIAAGIKDLDLVLKRDRRLQSVSDDLLVLGDVPASFVAIPESRLSELQFLAAQPPLPPSGAYRFGAHRLIGLARRGDDPSLEEVLARFPALRLIRLRLGPQQRIIARDVTESLLREPPAEGEL